MSINEYRSRMRARIWRAVAQSDLDLSCLPESELESLVDLVTEASLLDVDDEMGRTLETAKGALAQDRPDATESEEQVLWRGRPFLSISREYVITDERIRIVEGLLGKDREDIELIRVQDIDQSQTLRERILSIGDITILSHDSSHPKMILNNVRDPESVHEILRRAILNARRRHGLIYREEM